jgi:hypothetical protein
MKTRPRKKKVKIRRFWPINPRTRVKKSGRIYSRKKVKKELKEIFEEP